MLCSNRSACNPLEPTRKATVGIIAKDQGFCPGLCARAMGDGAALISNGTSNGVVGPQAPAPAAACSNGNGNGGGNGGVEKVKFTVSVRGRQWSSARHVNETLEEFAAAIQRNARRLGFVEEDDTIFCLQLAYGDGSEAEDLDVDATLGDVIICQGDKQLVAVVNSSKGSANGNSSNGQASPIGNAIAAGRNGGVAPGGAASIDGPAGGKFTFPPYKPPVGRPKANNSNVASSAAATLKINIPASENSGPASLPFQQDVERGCSFHPDYVVGASLPPRPSNGKVPAVAKATSSQFCNPTPSPAELANMLVRSSHRMPPQGAGSNGPSNRGAAGGVPTTAGAGAPPTGGFQSFANALLSRLPMMPNQSIQCPHGATTNIALLAQFLASQLRAFVPPETTTPGADNKAAPNAATQPTKAAKASNNGPGSAPPSEKDANHHHHHHPMFDNGSDPKHDAANAKLSVSGSHDKDESSSSANVDAAVAPSSGDGVDSEHPNGRNELVFLVNRRSKTRPQGVGTHHLKMTDLSTYFHLSVVDAAKKLGVSQTTLKKACRKFGLKRWPGRKVRSLESTIHGLEHTIAVGQGAGLEELTEAYMRSEVSKLQQEMDQLVHGTPAQVTHTMHSPAVRTADLYKRLYSRGWRSKYHSPGRHDMINLNTGNHTNRTSGLTPPTQRKNSKAAKENGTAAAKAAAKPAAAKVDDSTVPKPSSRPPSRDTVMKDSDLEGLLPEPENVKEVHAINLEEPAMEDAAPVVPGVVEILENGANEGDDPKEHQERDVVMLSEEKEVATFAERSPKRPKRECRIAAEGAAAAVRQGLRSSTCA